MLKRNLRLLIIPILILSFSILIWFIIAELTPSTVIPYPLEVIISFIRFIIEGDNFGYTFLDHVFASLLRVVFGFSFAFLLAFPLGLIMGLSKKAKLAFTPIIEIFRPIPPFAWIPFALVFFKLGLISQSFIIFIGAFFPMISNTIKGVEDTRTIHVDVAKTLGATKSDIIVYVILPSTLPSLLVGIRVSLGVGWMCVIAAELVGLNVPVGLGYLIQYSAQFGNFGLTFATMFLTGLIGFAINSTIKVIGDYTLRWRDLIDAS
jgi:NitT/TauT family transport system permease protein